MTRDRRLLFVILLAGIVLSALFAAKTPYGSGLNPDETAHYGYLRLMAANHGLVKFTPPPGGTLAEGAPEPWETHQPPLYYLLCLPAYLLTNGNVFLIRLVSVVLQGATIALAFLAARDLFPKRSEIAPLTAAFVAFLPTQAQLGGAINNDALTTLVCAAVFWRLGRVVVRPQCLRDAAALGALLGIGLWTKLSVFQLFPIVIVAYAIAAQRKNLTWKRAASLCAAALGLSLLIASPWLIRNTVLYGDPLAQHIYLQTGPNHPPSFMMDLMHWSMGDYLRYTGIRTFASFWIILPPNAIQPSPLILLVTVVLAVGGALGAYRWASRGEGDEAEERAVVGLCWAGITLLVPFFVLFILQTFQAQGRYFLPALLPAAIVTVMGWSGYFPPKSGARAAVPAVIDGTLLILSLYQLYQFAQL